LRDHVLTLVFFLEFVLTQISRNSLIIADISGYFPK